ncbi:hypothetical protein BU25DRAFT_484518 [Macroventuria anomochaeta]|uniref:Uncharacterized protein n=1 Tax=Macroventuria anomochaeta TaxID=301207 RepID=A0ACB6SA89_9PLEO|nr:uncharacterized protein BU25DRAFT_484518 [Macroventuria anomochaeta]KAF2630432.1 hypothetical protein BU25DRAFT_484518 [Macroventuria anomochaeta]
MVRHEVTTSEGRSITFHVHDSLVPSSNLEKRVNIPSLSPDQFSGDACGASTFKQTSTGFMSLMSSQDCTDLVSGVHSQYSSGGHWCLTDGYGGSASRWIELASSGTCHIYIDRHNFPDPSIADCIDVGTFDLEDLVRSTMSMFKVKLATPATAIPQVYPAQGTMKCNPSPRRFVTWAIQNGSP